MLLILISWQASHKIIFKILMEGQKGYVLGQFAVG
jgi:hypothetical protein